MYVNTADVPIEMLTSQQAGVLLMMIALFSLLYWACGYLFQEKLTLAEEYAAQEVVEATRDGTHDVGEIELVEAFADIPRVRGPDKWRVVHLCVLCVVAKIGYIPKSDAAQFVVQREARKWMVERKMRPTDIATVLPHVPVQYFVRSREQIEATRIAHSRAYLENQRITSYQSVLPRWAVRRPPRGVTPA
jgi:hypothetical protein